MNIYRKWLAISIGAIALSAAQAVELPQIFSDGMVLQREQPIPIWGRALPGTRINVRFAKQQSSATANPDGHWQLELPAQSAGGPYQLIINDDHDRHELNDIWMGDVWLASGQSNMEWPLAQTTDADVEIAQAEDPLLRHFKIPKSWAGTPQWQLRGGQWIASSPQTAGAFSAVAWFFARELRKATGVPIGIIDSSWGGSTIEAWMDTPTQGLDTIELAALGQRLAERDQEALAQTHANLARWALPADDSRWQTPSLDTREWVRIPVPGLWEEAGWDGLDGIAWYRTTFHLSEAEAKAGIVLGVGRIDDSDITWVNGQKVGHTLMQYNQPREYRVPPSVLRAGTNHLAVRVHDTGGDGGIHGSNDELFIQPQGRGERGLSGDWLFRVAEASVNLEDGKNKQPTLLYNAMIHPVQPYALRGIIWYQGESNANTEAQAGQYRQQFPALIRQWRAQWQAPELPFIWVQLASFGSGLDTPGQSPWALLRESQSTALTLPATAQAVVIDIGDADDIHPRNKHDVGKRLALAARHIAYGESLIYSGPVFLNMRISGTDVVVSFKPGHGGLAARNGREWVDGFELAGADRIFHPAQAHLREDTIVVHSAAVPIPVAVRYAWHDAPIDADLVNGNGLPASPFRSDTW